ncbi:MAG: c-type cytochrome [Gemmatimonadaceae bacterium]
MHRTIAPYALLAVALGCADAPRSSDTSAVVPPSTMDTGSSGGSVVPGEGGLALGRQIFQGQAAGGLCQTCHGMDAKGTQLGPDLTDANWLNTDGTLAGITQVIRTGVATPKQYPGPMPPMGGSQLTDDQITAVAEYVKSLSA